MKVAEREKIFCAKKMKQFAELIFAIKPFWEIFAELISADCIVHRNFAEVIFANKGQNRKNKFAKISYAKIYFANNFFP